MLSARCNVRCGVLSAECNCQAKTFRQCSASSAPFPTRRFADFTICRKIGSAGTSPSQIFSLRNKKVTQNCNTRAGKFMDGKKTGSVAEQTIDAKKKCAIMRCGKSAPKGARKGGIVRCCGRMDFGQFGEATFKFVSVSASL